MTFFGFGHKGEKLGDPQLQHNSPPDSKNRIKVCLYLYLKCPHDRLSLIIEKYLITLFIAPIQVSGPEPGYVTTPICMVAAALTVLEESQAIPLNGGVLTPGSAFKRTSLIERLRQRGMKFVVEG